MIKNNSYLDMKLDYYTYYILLQHTSVFASNLSIYFRMTQECIVILNTLIVIRPLYDSLYEDKITCAGATLTYLTSGVINCQSVH